MHFWLNHIFKSFITKWIFTCIALLVSSPNDCWMQKILLNNPTFQFLMECHQNPADYCWHITFSGISVCTMMLVMMSTYYKTNSNSLVSDILQWLKNKRFQKVIITHRTKLFWNFLVYIYINFCYIYINNTKPVLPYNGLIRCNVIFTSESKYKYRLYFNR